MVINGNLFVPVKSNPTLKLVSLCALGTEYPTLNEATFTDGAECHWLVKPIDCILRPEQFIDRCADLLALCFQ